MTTDVSLIITPYRLRHYDAFRSPLLVTCFPKIVILNGARMLCEKAGKRDGEMEWRIYYPDDILRLSSPRQQILRFRSGWRLNVLYKDHRAGRQKELLAHVVRLRILACR